MGSADVHDATPMWAGLTVNNRIVLLQRCNMPNPHLFGIGTTGCTPDESLCGASLAWVRQANRDPRPAQGKRPLRRAADKLQALIPASRWPHVVNIFIRHPFSNLAQIKCCPPAALKNPVRSLSALPCAWSSLLRFYGFQVRPPTTPILADAHTICGIPPACCRVG